ncbi:MAG: flagellin lysine-N-methylase [Clostridia bacterium]|nr:flagellin lysine-N-methylase [Clostridia bacterium]
MKNFYPAFYSQFKCIANKCEDSCCKDWDIDVDSETEQYYNSVSGELGDKIRRLTVTDKYGERVFINNTECGVRCPFWNKDMLCDIYIGLGEEHLSHTCATFPRLKVDHYGCSEHILSFACPEAARFMLRTENAYDELDSSERIDTAPDDVSAFMIESRRRTAEIFRSGDPMIYKLIDCLVMTAQIERILQGEEPAPLDTSNYVEVDIKSVFELHKGFEIMSKKWRDTLNSAAEECENIILSREFDDAFGKFAEYYIYRYYLTSLNEGDAMYAVKRIIFAYLITSGIYSYIHKYNIDISIMRILQRYSKEVEHSYENTEKMNDALSSNDNYSAESILLMLEGICDKLL